MSGRVWMNRLSLRQRLITVIFTVSATVSAITFFSSALLDVYRLKANTLANAVVIAETVASYSIPDLLFHDTESAKKTLQSIKNFPALQQASILENDGSVFASLHSVMTVNELDQTKPAYAQYRGGLLHVVQPVIQEGKPIGSVYLIISTHILKSQMQLTLLILSLVLVMVLIVALLLSFWMQNLISRPIVHLAEVAKRMSSRADFSERVTTTATDEIGTLFYAFNALLDGMQEHANARAVAYEDLKASESRIRLLLDSTAEAIYGLNLEGICTFVNPACVRILGYRSEDDLVGKDMHEQVHHHFLNNNVYPVSKCPIVQAPTKKESRHGDTEWYWRADGSSFPIEYWTHPIIQENKVIGTVVTFVDITQRKVAVEKSRVFAALVEASTDFIGLADMNGHSTYVNPSGRRLLGIADEGFIGKTIKDFVTPQDWPFVEGTILPTVMRQGYWYDDYRLRHFMTDEPVEVAMSIFAIHDEQSGEPMAFVNISHDIRELKNANARIRQLNAELEQRVRERTAQLEVANKELVAFSYSVSHDLRAPLRAIDGFSKALAEDYAEQLDNAAKGYLQRVRKNAQLMERLIEDLLNLSRVSRASLKHILVDLSELAQSVMEGIRQNEPSKRQVDVDISQGMQCTGDPGLLRVVLENLLGNAWKYTSKIPHASIRFDYTHEQGDTVYRIQDNGTGFDMKYADKLFGAFQRLHHRDEFEGTGIGLATVARIVHRHGGRVWTLAEKDVGATFFFTLWSDLEAQGLAPANH